MSTSPERIELPERPATKTELMERLARYWSELEREIDPLSEQDMITSKPEDGWAVKDHLAHLTTWERVMLARIEQAPEHGFFGMDEATYEAADSLDALNARAYERNRTAPLVEVLVAFHETHQQLVAALERLSDADLARPVFPNDPAFGTLMDNAAGDTYEHYIEHLTWIRAGSPHGAGDSQAS